MPGSFLRNGANPFELQIALGHTTLEMTRKYTQALGFEDVFKRHVMASPVDRLVRRIGSGRRQDAIMR